MNPQGSVCLNFLLCWHLFMENDYTAQVPPCIKPKQTAAKTTLKDQHALIVRTTITLFCSSISLSY